MLRPGGIALIADERTEDAFTAPGDEIERIYYGFSLFTCLPAAMTERPTAGDRDGHAGRHDARTMPRRRASAASSGSTSPRSTCSGSTCLYAVAGSGRDAGLLEGPRASPLEARQARLDHRVVRRERDPEPARHLDDRPGQDDDVLLGEDARRTGRRRRSGRGP